MTAPGIGWITNFTIAAEIGDITRFSLPVKLTGYTGLCPRVKQSGDMDQRGPVSKHGPKYLRWGLMEAAIAASSYPLYKERYQRTKRRLGRQRGAKVAQIELARKLTEAIWHMLTRNQPFEPFAPAGAVFASDCLTVHLSCATGASPDHTWSSKLTKRKSDEHSSTINPGEHPDNIKARP
jgi:transposase